MIILCNKKKNKEFGFIMSNIFDKDPVHNDRILKLTREFQYEVLLNIKDYCHEMVCSDCIFCMNRKSRDELYQCMFKGYPEQWKIENQVIDEYAGNGSKVLIKTPNKLAGKIKELHIYDDIDPLNIKDVMLDQFEDWEYQQNDDGSYDVHLKRGIIEYIENL